MKRHLLFVGLACLFVAGLAGCKRQNAAFALFPWDAAAMASCDQHGPHARTCFECNGGDVQACLAVARVYEGRFDVGRSLRDAHTAALFHGRACEQDYLPSCALIGQHYATVRADYFARDEAAKLRDRSCSAAQVACEARDALACRVHGMCLGEDWSQRKTIARDIPGAKRSLAAGCELGDALACARLGWLSEGGKDDASIRAALAAYERACDADLAEGCVGLATHLHYGLGTAPDPAKAAQIADEWCARGSVQACHVKAGRHTALWPLLLHDGYPHTWSPEQAKRLASLDLQAGWSNSVGRTGFCIRDDGGVDQVDTLDTTGDPAVDKFLRDNVASWKFPQRPAAAAPLCLVHEHTFLFAIRTFIARPYYIVASSWLTAPGGVTLLDHDWQRPARNR